MTPRNLARLRVVAWACVLAVLLAAAVPTSAGLPAAILAAPAPAFGETGPSIPVDRVDQAPPSAPISLPTAARAPPLA